jgi:hypothetical protein
VSTTTAEADAGGTYGSFLGALAVAAPLAERDDELVRALIVGPEVVEQDIEVVGGFDPLLVCDGF